MKRTFLTAFALLSLFNAAVKADEVPNSTDDKKVVKHLNLEEVEINASRVNAKLKDLPQKIEVITQRTIEASPAVDVAGLLKRSASIDILQYPGVQATVSMRGFTPSPSVKYTVILVDGKPAGTENIASINLQNVERVEILKGPFSAQYGSAAMAGVVNIVTKNSTGELSGRFDTEYGSFNTSKLNLGLGGAVSERMDFDLGFAFNNQGKDYKTGNRNLYDEKYAKSILDESTYGERMENTKFTTYNLNTRLGIKLAEDWKINLNGGYYRGDDIETPGNFWHTEGMDSKDIERFTTGFDVVGKNKNHSIKFSPFYSNEENKTIDVGSDGYGDFESVYKNYGFQLTDSYQIGKHNLALGLDNKTEKYESTNFDTSGNVEAPYQPDYKNIATGVYTQLQFKLLNDKLNLMLGARGDHIKFKLEADDLLGNDKSSEDYWELTSNIGVKYEMLKGLSAHISYGDAFLAPKAYQVAGKYTRGTSTTVGNPDLNPETSKTIDFGLSYNSYRKGINFDFTYFKTDHKDKIIRSYLPDYSTTYINAQSADMNGLELSTSYDFGALKDYDYSLRLYLNYTHLIDATVKYKDAEDNQLEGEMRYVRDNTASFGIEFDNLKGFSTRLNGRYIGHRYENNYMYLADYSNWPNITKEPIVYNEKEVRPDLVNDELLRHPVSYVFDYSASYSFNENYTVGFSISNLLDENYTEKDGYNMPGRAFMAKFSYQF
ncbi:TonB-dependent receptor plug domain-containing protein [Marinifilum sp. D737]|uniref:TonB-dependent receptor plug domain-containing protein n=1 Tax=Marinifilum sp. D737 TaxID=2969628 RepID=UPI002272E4BA|nr:TonB-dependent receptor [Marinifilum sp. D737]MCY1634783.1 TonB-dependent receptor [Marinifilum sp. D737]